jgi:hypothetical protein
VRRGKLEVLTVVAEIVDRGDSFQEIGRLLMKI